MAHSNCRRGLVVGAFDYSVGIPLLACIVQVTILFLIVFGSPKGYIFLIWYHFVAFQLACLR